MCEYAPNREAAMTIIEPGKVWCDPCIAPLVKALNAAGLETVASCCGHNALPGRITLRSGETLIVADEWQVRDGAVIARRAARPDGDRSGT